MSDKNDPRFTRPFESFLEGIVIELHSIHQELHAGNECRKSHSGLATKHDLEQAVAKIMKTQAEIIADLKAVVEQLKTVNVETKELQASVDALKAKIVELEALVAAGGGITQELVDVVGEVKVLSQTVDDNIPSAQPIPLQS